MHTVFEKPRRQRGFGLVELVVTVAILGVLMLVAIPVFGAVQKKAADNVTKSSIEQLVTAVDVARAKTNKTMGVITGNFCTECNFRTVTDPKDLPKSHSGWVAYNKALDEISKASGIDVRTLVDGYGRPLRINENEGESGGCLRDEVGSWANPHTWPSNTENQTFIYTFKC